MIIKKMFILIIFVCFIALVGCGGSGSSNSQWDIYQIFSDNLIQQAEDTTNLNDLKNTTIYFTKNLDEKKVLKNWDEEAKFKFVSSKSFNGKTINNNEKIVNNNEETVNDNGETINDNGETINNNGETINNNEETVNDNEKTVNDNEKTVNDNEETINKQLIEENTDNSENSKEIIDLSDENNTEIIKASDDDETEEGNLSFGNHKVSIASRKYILEIFGKDNLADLDGLTYHIYGKGYKSDNGLLYISITSIAQINK